MIATKEDSDKDKDKNEDENDPGCFSVHRSCCLCVQVDAN